MVIGAMRLVGRAPEAVNIVSKAELVTRFDTAGFIVIEQPDVGANPKTAFVVAHRPS